ncbi:MAG: GntR family transcriptional regulator [Motiliproteus sp.]
MSTDAHSSNAYIHLRDDILSGSLKPSSKLQIAALKERYETSAAPVREALSRLAAEGLVIKKGQRGFWAAPVSMEEFRDVSRLRVMLEIDAFKQSIENGDLEWEATIVGARHREKAVTAQANGDLASAAGALINENRAFHLALIANCPSDWQKRFISTLYDQSERFRRLSILNTEEVTNEQSEHEAIMAAAFSRDVKKACSLLTSHIEDSTQRVLDAVFSDKES